jgi:hypothetical protein
VRPAIPVSLTSIDGSKTFPLYAIPDSGADSSCFPEEWASPLGIDLAACIKRRVMTGAGITHHHEWKDRLEATVAGRRLELRATFGPVTVGLLGRDDFFSYFRVEFDHQRRVVVLRPYAGAN